MALYISLGSRKEGIDFNRFRSAFFIYDYLFGKMKIKDSDILFYQDYPIQELNSDFKRIKFDFGILESKFRSKIENLENEGNSIKAGFELEFDLIINKRKFRVVFELLPRNKSKYYDIIIDILSNGHGDSIEDLENFNKKFRNILLDKIIQYNNKAKSRSEHLFNIRRAIMSAHKKEFHNIDSWKFYYSKEPEEFINHLSYGNKDLKERLTFANRQKFAQFLTEFNAFVYSLFDYAREYQVQVEEGSLAFIPKDEKAMKKFINELKNKVDLVAKETYPTKKEFNERLINIFYD